jgi:hypothetical protein
LQSWRHGQLGQSSTAAGAWKGGFLIYLADRVKEFPDIRRSKGDIACKYSSLRDSARKRICSLPCPTSSRQSPGPRSRNCRTRFARCRQIACLVELASWIRQSGQSRIESFIGDGHESLRKRFRVWTDEVDAHLPSPMSQCAAPFRRAPTVDDSPRSGSRCSCLPR